MLMDATTAFFWLAVYAIVIGSIGDAFAVFHGIMWLRKKLGSKKNYNEIPFFQTLILLDDIEKIPRQKRIRIFKPEIGMQ